MTNKYDQTQQQDNIWSQQQQQQVMFFPQLNKSLIIIVRFDEVAYSRIMPLLVYLFWICLFII